MLLHMDVVRPLVLISGEWCIGKKDMIEGFELFDRMSEPRTQFDGGNAKKELRPARTNIQFPGTGFYQRDLPNDTRALGALAY